MLHSFLYAPFADAARHAQFDAVQLALEAEGRPGTAVLLGNLRVAEEPLEAVLVTGHSITALFFRPGGGHLSVAPTGAWQLNGQPVAEEAALDNCRQQLLRLRPALATWLASQLGAAVSPAQITGLVVFEDPVSFGPEVETHLHPPFGPRSLQLLGAVDQLPHFLKPAARPAIQLPEAALRAWAEELAGDEDAEDTSADAAPMGFWEQQARQLWRWLGAEDVPHDAPYGGYAPPDAGAARQQEKARLELIRQQVRAEVQAQSQAAAAREAEREQLIARLQAQLAQATAVAPEAAALQAQLAAETREKAALAEAMRAAQAESAARNQQLDARIDQLAALIRQSPAPPPPAAAPTALPSGPARPGSGPPTRGRAAPARRLPARRPWQLRWSRVAVVAAVLGWAGAAVWGLSHLTRQFFSQPAAKHTGISAAPQRRPAPAPAAADSAADPDGTDAAAESELAQDSAAATVIQAPLVVDSTQVMPAVEAPDLDEPAPGN